MAPKRLCVVSLNPKQRAVQRAPLGRLSDHIVQPATLKRYRAAYTAFVAWTHLLGMRVVWDSAKLDGMLAMYVEHLWESWQSRGIAGDAISAVQFYGRMRRCFPHAWKLWSTWARLELPSRAPPLPENLLGAFVEYAFQTGAWAFATLLIVAFVAFLRTTEMLTLERWQLEFGSGQLLVRLPATKSAKRRSLTEESVLIEEPLVVALLWQLLRATPSEASLWPYSPAAFRLKWSQCC
eukprot:6457137-Amphidinium_carterae.2